MPTVGELEDKVRELQTQVEQLAQASSGNADLERKVLTALADSGATQARIASLEQRVHDLDGKVAS